MADIIGYFPFATQNVTVGVSSTQSTAFRPQTRQVRLVSDADCYIAFGASATATTSSMLLPAGVVEYFEVHPGDLIAVIQKSTTGNLNIAEMGR